METHSLNTASCDAVLLAHFKKHNFSKSAKGDILKVLKHICPESNCATSAYDFEKHMFKVYNFPTYITNFVESAWQHRRMIYAKITNVIYTNNFAGQKKKNL